MKRGGFIKRRMTGFTEKPDDEQSLWPLYREIWAERAHVSAISGEPLEGRIKSWMFDHLLEQEKYPHLRGDKNNIILCTFAEHEVKSLGNPLPEHKRLIKQAKKNLL